MPHTTTKNTAFIAKTVFFVVFDKVYLFETVVFEDLTRPIRSKYTKNIMPSP
jgi:hypothetical protein